MGSFPTTGYIAFVLELDRLKEVWRKNGDTRGCDRVENSVNPPVVRSDPIHRLIVASNS